MKESAVVFLRLEGTKKILLLMRKEGWCIPGGKMEDSDKTHQTCALRELKEETGILVVKEDPSIRYIGKSLSVSGRTVHIFSAVTNQKKVKINKNEHTAFQWTSYEELAERPMAGNTMEFIKMSLEKLLKNAG